MDDQFLGVEPEVVVLSTNEAKNHLMLQVLFRGMDKLSVKFEFNADTDTAEEVVNEMVRRRDIHGECDSCQGDSENCDGVKLE